MTLTRKERNANIQAELQELTDLRGVTTAALIDPDGFVTHIQMDFEVDTDALGAAVRLMIASANRAAQQTEQVACRLLISENVEGFTIATPLSNDFVVALVADPDALLGRVRFELKETWNRFEGWFAS